MEIVFVDCYFLGSTTTLSFEITLHCSSPVERNIFVNVSSFFFINCVEFHIIWFLYIRFYIHTINRIWKFLCSRVLHPYFGFLWWARQRSFLCLPHWFSSPFKNGGDTLHYRQKQSHLKPVFLALTGTRYNRFCYWYCMQVDRMFSVVYLHSWLSKVISTYSKSDVPLVRKDSFELLF